MPFPRLRTRTILALAAAVIVLGGGWLWLRDSSLVAVKHVVINGDNGPDAAQIRRALIGAAKSMTTLDVGVDELRSAVAPYPVVKDVQVSTQFPHGLRIHVVEQIPVAALSADGRTIAVAGDGTLLRDMSLGSLPQIQVRVPPGGNRLSDPAALRSVAVLAAAPYALLAHISQVAASGGSVVAQLRGGPQLLFGAPSSLRAKWAAAVAVLADHGSAGAAYIDVSDPARPAAGASPARAGAAGLVASAAAAATGSAASAATSAGSAATASTGG